MVNGRVRVGLTWCACLAVLCGAVTVFAGSDQVVRVAVVDAGGNLLPEAGLQAANVDGTRGVAVTRLEDDTFAIKGAGAKLVLQVQHPDLGSASALLSLPADPEVSVAVYLESGTASAVVVDSRLPEVTPLAGISATAPVISGPFAADITPTRAASGEVTVRDPAARLIGEGPSDRGAGEARQGGEDCASAVELTGALPIVITGTTTGYVDDYEVMDGAGCPYSSDSEDVVYVFYPAADNEYTVDICDSFYDTKLFVYEDDCASAAVACNDDACGSDGYKSMVTLDMFAGHAYYIVIDGYGGDDGDYVLVLSEYIPPPPDCPPDTLFGQAMDGNNAANSDVDGGYIVYENFWGLEGIISGVHWKGLNAVFDGVGWSECGGEGVDSFFDITFFGPGSDPFDGGVVCSYTGVLPSKVDTGDTFAGFTVYRYEMDLPAPCMLLDGWVSIVGSADPTCWELWISSTVGDGMALQAPVGGDPAPIAYDMGMCLTGEVITIFGACCDDLTGTCEDCVTSGECEGEYARFAPNTTCEELDPSCGEVVGGCCLENGECQDLTPGECLAAGGEYQGNDNLCPDDPCLMCGPACPAGSTMEGEPVCGPEYDDTYNGGCNSTVPVFQTITCDETMCGESGNFTFEGSDYRDTDWFELVLTEPQEVTWTVQAEFDVLIFLIDGTDGCDYLEIITNTTAGPCEIATVMATVPAGTYWLWVGPSVFTGIECGAKYVGTVTCNDPPPPPPNDDCVNAIDVGALPATVTENVTYANDDIEDPCGVYSGPWKNIWYTVTGTGNTITATTCNAGTMVSDTKISVFCVDCENLVCVDGNDDDCDGYGSYLSTVEWCSEAGATYYVTVGLYSSTTSPGVIQLDVADGDACSVPMGACCVEGVCVATMSKCACGEAGGFWFEGETCPEFTCPIPGGETCANPIAITLPAEMDTVASNTTCGKTDAYDDTCLGYYDGGEDITYEIVVTAPVGVEFVLDSLGTTYAGMGMDEECPLGGSGCIFTATGYSGPYSSGCLSLGVGTYYLMIDTWPSPDCIPAFDLHINTCEVCDVDCVGTDEGETCGADTNGGCNMATPTFTDLTLGTTYCGTGWADGGTRDTDWYEVVTTEAMVFTMAGEGEFGTVGMVIGLVETTPPGSGDCATATALNPYVVGGECEEVAVMTECLPAGTYWFFVGAGDYYDLPCGANNDYEITVTGVSCAPPTGACCVEGVCTATTEEPDCTGSWYEGETCPEFACPAGADCGNPIQVSVPGDLAGRYTDVNSTCGMFDDYSDTCMGSYDGAEDILYELTVTEETCVDITMTAGSIWTGMAVDYDCPLNSGTCLAVAAGTANPEIIEGLTLPAGTYYLMIDTWPSPYCDDYTLDISVCAGGYCSASGGCDEYIENVTVGSIDNTTGCDEYADYTAQSTAMTIGTGYAISITVGNAYSSDKGGVWVDWNQDEDFDDTGEQITLDVSDGYGPYTGTITPPTGATVGDTVMRVRVQYGGTLEPCGTTSYGEVEDYTITVGAKATVDLPYWDDEDVDGFPNFCDNCPVDFNEDQADEDDDFVGDLCDNCFDVANGRECSNGDPCQLDDDCTSGACEQADADGDGVGDACDNCVDVYNPSQTDNDDDGFGNACDNCVNDPNPGQEDADGDGYGDACDLCPFNPCKALSVPQCGCDAGPEWFEGDCSTPDGAELDSDGDGVSDCCDNCPFGEWDPDFEPVCDSDDGFQGCEDAIPTVSTWGLIVLALVLLVLGKVYFGRRTAKA